MSDCDDQWEREGEALAVLRELVEIEPFQVADGYHDTARRLEAICRRASAVLASLAPEHERALLEYKRCHEDGVETLLDWADRRPYTWEICPSGWCGWHIKVCHGLVGLDAYVIGSRSRAIKKAKRLAAKWRRDSERTARQTVRGNLGADPSL